MKEKGKNEETGKKGEEKQDRFAFFIGCTTHVRLPYIEKLARQIFRSLGFKLVDLDFSCCPTPRVIKDVDIGSWLVIAARNLAVAEKQELPILSMCTGCTQTLKEAKHRLEDRDTRVSINEQLRPLGLEYTGSVEVKFYAELLHENMELVKKSIKSRLPMNIAAHPGCHILRPSHIIKFDDPENPVKLDELIGLLGADAVKYKKKGLCCGFPLYDVDRESSEKMMKDKFASVYDACNDTDCITVLCPTCFEYYELRQLSIAAKMSFRPLMVMHYLQLLGLALGFSADEIGLSHMRHKDETFIGRITDLQHDRDC